jgi:hypothetical protein
LAATGNDTSWCAAAVPAAATAGRAGDWDTSRKGQGKTVFVTSGTAFDLYRAMKNSFRQTLVFRQTNSARRQSGPQDLLITDYIFLTSDFRSIKRPINPHEPDF